MSHDNRPIRSTGTYNLDALDAEMEEDYDEDVRDALMQQWWISFVDGKRTDSQSRSAERLQILNRRARIKGFLPPADFVKIKKTLFKPGAADNDGKSSVHQECSVCYDEFKGNDGLRMLKCGHVFHDVCLRDWMLQSYVCPLCRDDQRSADTLARMRQEDLDDADVLEES
eukprot:ANDGO_06621.mRNA.1 E3 ubiquitin-protein ligase RING1